MTGHEIARQLERERRPWWVIWYGNYTRHFWALASWVPGPAGALEAATPSMLIAAINNFEMFPSQAEVTRCRGSSRNPRTGA